MDPESFQLVLGAFERAIDLPKDEREAFAREAFPDREELRRELGIMLAGHGAEPEFLQAPEPASLTGAARIAGATTLTAGDRVGDFELVRPIGAGGMGMVWEAVQLEPRRTVALKTLRSGLGPGVDVRRFREESRLLARLSHPGIAQILAAGVLEAGEGEAGLPWFAMEHVPGAEPLDQYIATKELSVAERLALLRQVCDAVHHGHQRGVVHRDIKPDNVLVGEDGRVKVIDFGIAKAVDAEPDGATLTSDGQLVGTLLYMSPEQLGRDRDAIDLRTDVHALGALLFVLLCGRPPWTAKGRSLTEIGRDILERDPTPPSRLKDDLSPELDWIVARAMAKEPDERYASADALGADIERFLGHEPLEARPSSRFYQLRKFTRRNRVLVGGLAAAFAILLLAVAIALSGMVKASRERASAVQAAERSEAVRSFFLDIFQRARPDEMGRKVTVLEALEEAEGTVEAAFPDQPVVRADVHESMGRTYDGLGELEAAERHLRTALKLREDELGDEHPDTLMGMGRLATILLDVGRVDMPGAREEAADLTREALSIAESLEELEPLSLVLLLRWRAQAAAANADFELAAELTRRETELAREHLGPDSPHTRDGEYSLEMMGGAHMGGSTSIDSLRRAAVDTVGEKGIRHPHSFAAQSNLAFALQVEDRWSEAEAILVSMIPIVDEVQGEEHPRTGMLRNQLWQCLFNQERYEEAAAVLREAVEFALRKRAPSQDLLILQNMQNLAFTLHRVGSWQEMAEHFDAAFEASSSQYGIDHPSTLYDSWGRADARIHLGRMDEAAALIEAALAEAADAGVDPESLWALESALSRCAAEADEPVFAAARERLREQLARAERGQTSASRLLRLELEHLDELLGDAGSDE